MRKLITILLSLCIFCTTFVTLTVPSFALDNISFSETYFPNGKLSKPETPYLYVEDSIMNLFLEQVPELMQIAEDYQIYDENIPDSSDDFFEANDVCYFSKCAQIDFKFDDNPWASENGNWDDVDGRDFDTGSYDFNSICFAVSNAHDSSLNEYDNSKMARIRQADLWYYDPDDSMYSYIHPYVRKDGDYYCFNLEDHTFAVRLRWYVTYEEDGEQMTFFSDWSDETSIGKNGTQEEATLPVLEAPTLSDFSLVANEDGSCSVKYYIDIDDSAYKANRYHYIHDDYIDSYLLVAQIKKDDGEWEDAYTSNASWLINGYRTCGDSGDLDIEEGDDTWIRVRIVCSSFDEEPSPWSNIIGTKALEGETDSASSSDDSKRESRSHDKSHEAKCDVCGICPVQPLGICLFIWIAIILVIILIVVILVLIAKKRSKKNKK